VFELCKLCAPGNFVLRVAPAQGSFTSTRQTHAIRHPNGIDTVGHQRGDRIARPIAQRKQLRGQSVRPETKLSKGQGLVLSINCRTVATKFLAKVCRLLDQEIGMLVGAFMNLCYFLIVC